MNSASYGVTIRASILLHLERIALALPKWSVVHSRRSSPGRRRQKIHHAPTPNQPSFSFSAISNLPFHFNTPRSSFLFISSQHGFHRIINYFPSIVFSLSLFLSPPSFPVFPPLFSVDICVLSSMSAIYCYRSVAGCLSRSWIHVFFHVPPSRR